MSDQAQVWRKHWFVAARSDAVRSTPQRVVIFGVPLVLLRRADAAVWAMEDRCPHRGAMLSAGRSVPLGLRCQYHGWTFAQDGRCTAMPGAPDNLPLADVRVPSYAVIERDGLIWVSSNAKSSLPERVLALAPPDRRFLWQELWQAPILEIQENFLDALHTHTVHGSLLRQGRSRKPVQVKLRLLGDGFQVDYQGQPEQTGLVFKLFESQRTRERAYLSTPAVAQLEYQYAAGWSAWITLYFTSQTERTTHLFGSLHVRGRRAPRWLVRLLLWPLIRRVVRQDRAIVEQQERQGRAFSGRRTLVTELDIARPYLEAAWNGEQSSLPTELHRILHL